MRTLIIWILVVAAAWAGWRHFLAADAPDTAFDTVTPISPAAPRVAAPEQVLPPAQRFQCDGRTRCSQMQSCEEATFFIRNCPNTEMDGDSDGVPCESQWCG